MSASPLRHQPTIGSCQFGGHAIWWDVNAASEAEALELLPSYIAQRTTVVAVATVAIPYACPTRLTPFIACPRMPNHREWARARVVTEVIPSLVTPPVAKATR